MKNKIVFIATLIFLTPSFLFAQHHGSFEKFWFVKETDTLPYRLLLPANYDSQKKYPLILFLHGSGERGNNNASQLNHGGKLFTSDSIMENYPAIVVFPQCAAKSRWSSQMIQKDIVVKKGKIGPPPNAPPTKDMQLLMDLITELQNSYPVDKRKMYVGGLSLGGMGTYDLVYRMPKTFAAAFPICGGGNVSTVKNMKNTSWWIFHGQKDSSVLVEYSKTMAAALKVAGAKVKLTIYPEDGHNSWDDAFKEPGLFAWMFKKKLKD